MSATVVILSVQGSLLAVVILFVVALLRSHAEILRRLGAIDGSRSAGVPAAVAGAGTVARDVVGETLTGDGVKIALGAGSSFSQTLLAFMSTGCTSCGPLWAAMHDGGRVPAGVRLVVVTKGSDQESVARLDELAPTGHALVMSSAAWRDYEVPSTPHFVLVDGESGAIGGRGSAGSWEQLMTLIEQASSDAEHQTRPTATSAQRAARAEEALARSGITPGHPSLYPSRSSERE